MLDTQTSSRSRTLTLRPERAARPTFARIDGLGLVSPCVETLRQHAAARQIGFDDGRLLFTASRDDVMIGVCGLHRYIWGPSDIAWLSWFFVAPEARNSTVGLWMFSELLDISQTMGLRALYVETPNGGEEYANVYRYLPRLGFERQACLPNYYANGTDMLILMLPLLPRERS
jgi:RimJ/RimL family protein N-acetyltransferase